MADSTSEMKGRILNRLFVQYKGSPNWKLESLTIDSKGKIACNVDLVNVLENTLFSFKYR